MYGWHQRGRTAACDIARGLHYLVSERLSLDWAVQMPGGRRCSSTGG